MRSQHDRETDEHFDEEPRLCGFRLAPLDPDETGFRKHGNVGQRIRMVRHRLKLTQYQLAARMRENGADTCEQVVSKWERGLCRPNARSMERLAAALECWLPWLEKGDER